MSPKRLVLLAVLLCGTFALAACDSAEERAEGHYQNAIRLIAEGDVDRAAVEFRNVFKLNGNHREARLAFARLMRDEGNAREAFAQYLRLAERHPDIYEPQAELAQFALDNADIETFETHGRKAIEIDPEKPESKAFDVLLRYGEAVRAEDPVARREAVAAAEALVAEQPENRNLRGVLIESFILDGDMPAALDAIDTALAAGIDDLSLRRMRLSVLNQLGRTDEVEDDLEAMVSQAPEDEELFATLVRWYLSRQDLDKAEVKLRSRIDPADPSPAPRMQLVRFLAELRSTAAARAEVERLIEEGTNDALYGSLLAGLEFDDGDRTGAITRMESILATAEPSEQTNNIKVALARMLIAVGNPVSARQKVDEVLAADTANVEALKLKAAWQIEDDNAEAAIGSLRTALEFAPRDPQLMTLLANAHLRNGNRELAGEMLALASEASNSAPEESLRFARFLIADDRLDTAERVLVEALRLAPGNVPILGELGGLYIRTRDWPRYDQVEATLRRAETDEATALADQLRLNRLGSEQKADEAISFLQGLAEDTDNPVAATVRVVQSQFLQGDYASAEAYLDEQLAKMPEDPSLTYLRAASVAALGRTDEARAIYRELLAADAANEPVWRALYRLERGTEGQDAAIGVLNEGLAAMPGSADLKWALAGELEATGDIDGAIAIYEDLYQANSNSTVIANNLASLITTYRDDAKSLQRAYVIARRLRGLDVPAFQDTYGWIALRRGEVDEALDHLQPAAAGLPDDPMVQYHLAEAYARAERSADALAQYQKAVSVAGPADTRPQFAAAREQIARLQAQLETADQ